MPEYNPLLNAFDTPFGVPLFSEIKLEYYKPALEQLIADGLQEIENIAQNPEVPSFENTVVALDRAGKHLELVYLTFSNLNSAETSTEMQELANDIAPMMTEYSNKISQHDKLFHRIKTVYENELELLKDPEEKTLLIKTYKGFVRGGANLNNADKKRYREVSASLSQASLKFGENVLAETNAFELVIEDKEDLKGLSKGILEAAAATAKAKGHDDKWVFTLQAPSFIPFMEYAENRALREKLYRAHAGRCYRGDDLDNQEIVKEIVSLRNEKANLLGFDSHADYVLEERMAKSPRKVNDFLNDLLKKALPKAIDELEEVMAYAEQLGFDGEFMRWDWLYYSRHLKDLKFQLDDELLRPYFQLENCIQGIFDVANRLYGLSFEENRDIPVYHKDVTAYEVRDENGNHLAVFLTDFFPRPSKRGGAWMTSFRESWIDEAEHRPIVAITCNFTPPTEVKPSLLSFQEVETLFHEFGHALHGILAKGKYSSVSGTNVYWDFVELPSQIMENWLKEKDCLDLFAKHYQTGSEIPDDFITRINESANFLEGYQTVRQISFGLMDLAWHSLKEDELDIDDVRFFEHRAMESTELFPHIDGACMSTQFSHIFQGGYAAGYYSYKWAEVLDADAFSLFKEKGIFNKDVADSFKQNVLSKGGAEHPMVLYKRFRGHEPTIDALLERAGLKKSQ